MRDVSGASCAREMRVSGVEAGDDDEPRKHGRVGLHQVIHHGGSADARQDDVEEDDGVVVLPEEVDGLLPVDRLVDVASSLFEKVSEKSPGGCFVFDDQGSWPHLRKSGAKRAPNQCCSMKQAARSTARARCSRARGWYEGSAPASHAISIAGESA